MGGNQVAHEGDAMTNGDLYLRKERGDEETLISIYGVSASLITRLGTYKVSHAFVYIYWPGCEWETEI
jgi:hypothetical protein